LLSGVADEGFEAQPDGVGVRAGLAWRLGFGEQAIVDVQVFFNAAGDAICL
jgi:hypothetical protein